MPSVLPLLPFSGSCPGYLLLAVLGGLSLFVAVPSIEPGINACSLIFIKWFIFNLHTREQILLYEQNAYYQVLHVVPTVFTTEQLSYLEW
jgi:hypothetical protein